MTRGLNSVFFHIIKPGNDEFICHVIAIKHFHIVGLYIVFKVNL